MQRKYAIIIPACNEEEAISAVLREIKAVLPLERFSIVVGVNGSSDDTAKRAREEGVLVAETQERGYGYGCQAAIDLCAGEEVSGYIFMAADGANDPREVNKLVAAREAGADMVIGQRTTVGENWRSMGLVRIVSNILLGFWCSLLSGRYFFLDLGPFRLIDSALFHRMQLQEWAYGWTIEAQMRAVQLGTRVVEVPVKERPRLAGEQKVSGVSWRQSLRIGWRIACAGWRVRSESRQS